MHYCKSIAMPMTTCKLSGAKAIVGRSAGSLRFRFTQCFRRLLLGKSGASLSAYNCFSILARSFHDYVAMAGVLDFESKMNARLPALIKPAP